MRLSGSWYCEELLVKSPGNQGTWNFFIKDHGNQGPDNQGLAVQIKPIVSNLVHNNGGILLKGGK